MDEREKTCCFTGHRPMKLPWGMNEKDPRCLALKLELAARLEALAALGYRSFLCGMALGCDMYFAEAVLALRDRWPDVRLEAAIPFGDQPGRWNEEQRRRYNRLIDAADKLTTVAADASAELKDIAQAGFKSLLAGWEEAKKTFGENRK